jgi:DNA topoisomerase IB
VVDPEVGELLATLRRRRGGGPELLAWREGRGWVDVRSEDINDDLKQVAGGDFTAKDFRTWNATVLAAVALSASWPAARSRTARVRAIAGAVQEVAHYLGNTPAVCRASYIDPRLFDRYRSGLTIAGALERVGDVDGPGEPAHQVIEQAVLELIEERRGEDLELEPLAPA